MSEELQGSGNSHTEGYLDGAPAADAFQGLIDKGLFADKPTEASAAPSAPVTPAPTAQPQTTSEPEETPEYVNLDDYLSKSGLERNSFLELPVTVKVDGQESQVPLSTLLRSYQTDAHVTQKSQALAEKQKQWEGESAQAKQVLGQQIQTAQAVANLAHQQLLGQYQNIDWNKLRQEDPGQWAALNAEFQTRANTIQQHLAQLQQVQQHQQWEAQQQQAKTLETERGRMLEAFPEWREPAKFQAARTEMTSYAKALGFNDAEIANIFDHRYMKVLMDASRYAALQAKSPAVLKMVRAAPAMPGPGARVTRDPKGTRLQQVREAGRSGRLARNEDAQAQAFSALIDAGA